MNADVRMREQADQAALNAVDAPNPEAWRAGFKTGLPTLFGIGAWGMVVGIAMVKSGLSVPQALGMTLLVFAGSAQLASLPLIAAQAPMPNSVGRPVFKPSRQSAGSCRSTTGELC